MQYTTMGRTGVRVSRVAMGTMGFGQDLAADKAIFDLAVEAGVNVFDCADVYRAGRSEERLGELMLPHRDNLVITTKAYFPSGPGVNDRGGSRYHLVRAVEASLRRLNTDRIDVFFLHRFDDDAALDESLRAVDDLVRQGKILYPAVSNFSAWQTQRAVDLAERWGRQPLVAVQPMYNLVKRQAEVEILPMAQANRLAVFPYSPLGGGLLTGKYGRSARPATGRLLDVAMYAERYKDDRNYSVAEDFTELARQAGVHPVTLAIAWVMNHPAVTAPLLGARTTEQLRPALAAAAFDMSDELYRAISRLSVPPPPATDRTEERGVHTYAQRLTNKG